MNRGFDWDVANIGHIAKHGVTAEEVEQVFANDPMIVGTQDHPSELRSLCFGHTNKGRFLTVVYTERRGVIRGGDGLQDDKCPAANVSHR